MNQTIYLQKIKTAINNLECSNHAQLLLTIAKAYKTKEAQAAVGAAILEMITSCTDANADAVFRILRGGDDSSVPNALLPEAAVLELARHYTDAVCTSCPDLNRAEVESDLRAAGILVMSLTIKGTLDGVKSFIEQRNAA